MRQQAGALLTRLRGSVTRTAVADRLGISRQSLMKLEEGGLSLDRLDAIAEAYGVEFVLIAVERDADKLVTHLGATPAPKLRDLVTKAPAS
jgi:transcriptional regulator with XRE-family HTH domain